MFLFNKIKKKKKKNQEFESLSVMLTPEQTEQVVPNNNNNNNQEPDNQVPQPSIEDFRVTREDIGEKKVSIAEILAKTGAILSPLPVNSESNEEKPSSPAPQLNSNN